MQKDILRQFSVPYNGEDPKKYLDLLLKYKNNVHDVYLGCPGIPDYFTQILIENQPFYYENCIEFLKMARSNNINCVLTLNAEYNNLRIEEKARLVRVINNYIQKYSNIIGVVCSDFSMAKILHDVVPYIELNTSCNCSHQKLSDIYEWKKQAGITLVNPIRDSIRNYEWLEELKSAGFRIKLLINEKCYINCPNLTSFCSNSKLLSNCISGNLLANPFITCMIFPQQLDKFDKVVDIYKIQGRFGKTEYIFSVLDVYSSGRNAKISEIFFPVDNYKLPRDFSTDEIDPKLIEFWDVCKRNCDECRRCEKELTRLLLK